MRPLFPSRTLALARALNEENLPDQAVATVPGEWEEGEEGGGTMGEGEAFEFPCRTWPLSTKEMETLVADRLQQPGLVGLVMPYGQSLPGDATVAITRHDTGVVEHYEVVGRIHDPTFAMMSRAIIKRIDAPEAA